MLLGNDSGVVIYGVKSNQDKLIALQNSDIERLELEIFKLKSENKLLKKMLKDTTKQLQEQKSHQDSSQYVN